jgi:hypothetical protein
LVRTCPGRASVTALDHARGIFITEDGEQEIIASVTEICSDTELMLLCIAMDKAARET